MEGIAVPAVSEILGCDPIFFKFLIRIKKLRKDRLSEEITVFKEFIYMKCIHLTWL